MKKRLYQFLFPILSITLMFPASVFANLHSEPTSIEQILAVELEGFYDFADPEKYHATNKDIVQNYFFDLINVTSLDEVGEFELGFIQWTLNHPDNKLNSFA